MSSILEVVALPGAAETLEFLSVSSETAFHREELENLIQERHGESPADMVDQFLASNLVEPYGDRLGISGFGMRTSLLAEAINGGDIEDIYRRIRRLGGLEEMYEIIRGRMTKIFFQSLLDRPGFGRLYICSPWINPTEREASSLRYAVLEQQRRTGSTPEVLVVTRPPELMPAGAEQGLTPFEEVGASIFFNRQLHSKLYVREPDESGRYSLAMVGSQNLTKSRNLELGVRINGDSRLIGQLIAYFMDLVSWSKER